ncbi:FUSC family protein [Paraburkholderia sp. BCC1884]|uniref:FUSC family protein n=1 Tax=Paraburkholderia sp. BCC1884 TaxID=2562668 RepID=UPI0016433E19|nr:FUSC family protein [Paraburkholderia sp. BCC1884]
MKRVEIGQQLAFVIRCALAAVVAYKVAELLGLSMPVWASISALVVSQERWHETRASLHERIQGTLLGVGISLAVNFLAMPFHVPPLMQLLVAVAFCATIARADRGLRVCMWTCPLVLMSGKLGGEVVLTTGLYRSIEIVIGCLVAALIHWMVERLLAAREMSRT